MLLRLEDHDRGRCRPEYETALLEDLAWLGLEPDLGTRDELRAGPSPYRQSDMEAYYEAVLADLAVRATVFACDCSRKDMALAGGDIFNEETRYSGRCRARSLSMKNGLGARLLVRPGVEQFEDVRLGPQVQEPALQCGDLLLRDRRRQWTYHFAVVADDLRHGIDLVIRGEDLLDSTGRQILLGRCLGRSEAPVFLHHPLVRKPGGDKLSKSSRDTGIRELRAAGLSPAAALGLAAHRTGLQPRPAPVEARDLANLFGAS